MPRLCVRSVILYLFSSTVLWSFPVAARSKAWVCGRSLAVIVGSNPAGGMDVCCGCCVLSGRGLCLGLITRPEDPSDCGVSLCVI